MYKKEVDELGWIPGTEHEQLYGYSLVVWASLGDLVNSSVDPVTQVVADGALPAVDSFLVSQDSAGTKSLDAGAEYASILMSSWVHVTYDDQRRAHNERRFALEQRELRLGESGKSESLWRRELLLGQGCIIQTTQLTEFNYQTESGEGESGKAVEIIEFNQTLGVNDLIARSLVARLSRVPGSQRLRDITGEKRRLRETTYDLARGLHTIDPYKITSGAAHLPMYNGVPISTLTEPVIKRAENVNKRRLARTTGPHQATRLFDVYRAHNTLY